MPGHYADISRIYLVETRHIEVWSLVKTYTARGNRGVLYKVQWLTCVKKSSIIEPPWICRRLHWIQKLRYPCNKLVLTTVNQHFRTTPKPHVTGMRETPARCVWTKDNIGEPLTVTMFPVPFLGFYFVRLRKCRNISLSVPWPLPHLCQLSFLTHIAPCCWSDGSTDRFCCNVHARARM